MSHLWTVLYTHQKTKKAKSWQDGQLKVTATNNKATLYDEAGKTVLDAKFLGRGVVVECDMELEMDRYLVQVSEFKSHLEEEQKQQQEESASKPKVNVRFNAGRKLTFSDKPLASSLRKRKQLMIPLVKDNDDGNDKEPKDTNKTNKSKRQGRRGNREEEEDNDEDSAKAIKMRGLQDTRTQRSNSCGKITSLPSVGSFFTSSSIVETGCVEEISLPTKLQQGQIPQQGRNLDDIIEALRSGGEFPPQTASTFTLNDKKTISELHVKDTDVYEAQLSDDSEDDSGKLTLDTQSNSITKHMDRGASSQPQNVITEQAQPVIKRRRVGLSRSAIRPKTQNTDLSSAVPSFSSFKKSSLVSPRVDSKKENSTEVPQERASKKSFKPPVLRVYASSLSRWTAKNLCFPNAQLCAEFSEQAPSPQTIIPNCFESVDEYRDIFIEALTEEINFRLLELATKFHEACNSLPSGPQQAVKYACRHGPAQYFTVKKDGKNKGRSFYRCPSKTEKCKFFKWEDEDDDKETTKNKSATIFNSKSTCTSSERKKIEFDKSAEDHFKQRKIAVHVECDLIKTGDPLPNSRQGGYGRGQGRGFQQGNDFEDNLMFIKRKALFLRITYKEHYSKYSKDDLWIIASNPDFSARNADDIFFIARSAYHAPGQNNVLEIQPLTDLPGRLGRKTIVHAIHGPEASSELAMIDNLRSLPNTLPILPYILNNNGAALAPETMKGALQCLRKEAKNKWKIDLSYKEMNLIAEEMIYKYDLNEDQQTVLQSCASWFETNDQDSSQELPPPITLVHGVFGSGKSYLLVILIVFLCRVLDVAGNEDIRILVAASTNTAVDRVLTGLLSVGFTNFLRVGSLRKIAKPILQYSPQADDKAAEKDLKQRLKDEGGGEEESHIKKMLQEVRSGNMKRLVDKIASTRVIGVTCVASVFPILAGNTFPLVILDECSQMLEPLSMLPLGRYGCEKLVAVGDPLQLPPVLESFSDSEEGLAKTLFIRLDAIGFQPILLRTQYRCHPFISNIANDLFYSGRLINGVTPDQRAPLMPELPTLLFCNATDGKEEREFLSFYNEHELLVVVEMIKTLLAFGIKADQIGIIALYKAQAKKIEQVLGTIKAYDISEEYVEELLNAVDDLEQIGDEASIRRTKTKKWQDQQRNKLVARDVQVSTVDAFQGSEKEVIIVTCVRTTRLGFIDSPKRLNVTLTRARRHLFLVGHGAVLAGDSTWQQVLHNVETYGHVKPASAFLQSSGSTATDTAAAKEKEVNDGEEEDFDMMLQIQYEMEEEASKAKKAVPRRNKKNTTAVEEDEEEEEEEQQQQQRCAVEDSREDAFSLGWEEEAQLYESVVLAAEKEWESEQRASAITTTTTGIEEEEEEAEKEETNEEDETTTTTKRKHGCGFLVGVDDQDDQDEDCNDDGGDDSTSGSWRRNKKKRTGPHQQQQEEDDDEW